MDGRKRITWVFTILYFVAAVVVARLVDTGREAGLLTVLAVALAAVAAALLWMTQLLPRRRRGTAWRVVLLASVLPVVLVVGSALAVRGLARARSTAVAARSSRLVVSGVRAELLRSRRGNPLGVRLVYSVSFPDGPDVGVADGPTAAAVFAATDGWEQSAPDPRVTTTCLARRITPELAGGHHDRYQGGTTYTFADALVPAFLRPQDASVDVEDRPASKLCLDVGYYARRLSADADPPRRLMVYVHGTPVGEVTTESAYPLSAFHEGAIREGIPPCPDDAGPGLRTGATAAPNLRDEASR